MKNAVYEQWKENFHGKCMTCIYSEPSNKKKCLICKNIKFWLKGIPQMWIGAPEGPSGYVHKLFGCIYHKEVNYMKNIIPTSEIKPKKTEILNKYKTFGYIIPPGDRFWKVGTGEHKGLYGHQVGKYVHSCEIE